MRPFSGLDLRLQQRELFVSFFYSSLCSFSFRRRGVLVLDERLVFFICRCSPLSCSFSSSSGCVLLNLSSMVFLSLSFAATLLLRLSKSFWAFSLLLTCFFETSFSLLFVSWSFKTFCSRFTASGLWSFNLSRKTLGLLIRNLGFQSVSQ